MEIENTIEDTVSRAKHFRNQVEIKRKIETWRHRFDIANKFVDQINENFGLILLLNIAWIFYHSVCTFCDILIAYAFTMIVGLHFNLLQMFRAVILVEEHQKII